MNIKTDIYDHPIAHAIRGQDDLLVREIMASDSDLNINNLDVHTLYGLLEESGVWHGGFLPVDRSWDSYQQKVPSLYYKRLVASSISGEDLLLETLLLRGFLVFKDNDGVWLGKGSHFDDVLVLGWIRGIVVDAIENHCTKIASIRFSCNSLDELKVIQSILSIPQNHGFMAGPAYSPTYKGHSWLSYRNTVWGTKLSVCPSTYLGDFRLGYDALDVGIALLVKAWPLARVSTAFCVSCDGHGAGPSYIGFASKWDEVWARQVFVSLAMPMQDSKWFEGKRFEIKSASGLYDDQSVLALMDDIQRFARRLMQTETIEKIGTARLATLNKFGVKPPSINDFSVEAANQLAKVNLSRFESPFIAASLSC